MEIILSAYRHTKGSFIIEKHHNIDFKFSLRGEILNYIHLINTERTVIFDKLPGQEKFLTRLELARSENVTFYYF